MSSKYHFTVFKTTEKRLIVVWIINFLSILCGIIAAIGLRRFWKCKSYPFVQKRHAVLSFICSICCILILAVERPLFGFSCLSTVTTVQLQWLRWIMHIILNQTLIICVLLRIYVTCFEVNFARANSEQRWVKYIDTESNLTKTSWIVTKYDKYGNLYTIRPYIVCSIICSIGTIVILSIINPNIGFVVDVSFHILFVVIMCIIWYYTPYYLDHFKIRVEIRIILMLQFCLIVTNVSSYIIYINYFTFQFNQWLIIQCLDVLLLSSLSITQTWWVLYKFAIIRKTQMIRDREQFIDEENFQNQFVDMDDHLVVNLLKLEITDVIKEQIGFQAFMNHLISEFSIENMLALCEMIQYKTRFRQMRNSKGVDSQTHVPNIIDGVLKNIIKSISVDYDQKEEECEESKVIDIDNKSIGVISDTEEDDKWEIPETEIQKIMQQVNLSVVVLKPTLKNNQDLLLPDNLPFSTIVYGKKYISDDQEATKNLNLIGEAQRILNALFDKYVYVGSEFELDLGTTLRNKCVERLSWVDEMNETELEHIFDKVIAKLLTLMQNSYERFKKTEAFIRYEEKAKRRIQNDSLIYRENLAGIFDDLM
eukprot:160345_1